MKYTDLTEDELVGLLSSALDTDDVYPVFQPKFSAISNDLIGVETLVRWNNSVVGFVPPAVFIPLAEKTGIIDALTRKVLSSAVRQCSTWNKEGVYLNVAVNVSINDLHDSGLAVCFSDLLMEHGVDPSYITFEITETAIMSDRERCASVLSILHSMGTKLSIDDFGTGHAAFVYLKHFPITEIKIDKMFVDDILKNSFDEKLIRYVIDLAHELGCKVVAEGIETSEIAHKLRMLGCDVLQGYHLSKPITPQEVIGLFQLNQVKVYEYA